MVDGEELNPEDFGLGSEFDDALNEINSNNEEKHKSVDKDTSDLASKEDSRLIKTDFSKLKMILDVPLKITVELGRTKMLVNDLLQLGQGSVIELDKIAGEAMEIFINDKLVALGEVVVVNEKFGVRLTDVISQFGLGDVPQTEEE